MTLGRSPGPGFKEIEKFTEELDLERAGELSGRGLRGRWDRVRN